MNFDESKERRKFSHTIVLAFESFVAVVFDPIFVSGWRELCLHLCQMKYGQFSDKEAIAFQSKWTLEKLIKSAVHEVCTGQEWGDAGDFTAFLKLNSTTMFRQFVSHAYKRNADDTIRLCLDLSLQYQQSKKLFHDE
jgi:hypothetical protein